MAALEHVVQANQTPPDVLSILYVFSSPPILTPETKGNIGGHPQSSIIAPSFVPENALRKCLVA